MGPIVEFLRSPGAPLLVNVYPYFSNVGDPQNVDLDYAQFTMHVGHRRGGRLQRLLSTRTCSTPWWTPATSTSCRRLAARRPVGSQPPWRINARIYNTCRQRYKATASFSLTIASQTYKLTCCFQSGVAKSKIR
ncbi:hypothetical protein Taro_051070 [Colocasia esculenta]|uniref:Glucan endo-1,3-beta-D-glucosidase n=1 Tax=Colocasia esculenta TaxID=4460 RepID=A0A843XF08_COLES|nr:hypothetical protein [Colocasia esculenta]